MWGINILTLTINFIYGQSEFLAQVFKEIMIEYFADTHQLSCVDTVFIHDAIGGSARAIELTRQPAHGAFLPKEFLLDVLSDIYHNQ